MNAESLNKLINMADGIDVDGSAMLTSWEYTYEPGTCEYEPELEFECTYDDGECEYKTEINQDGFDKAIVTEKNEMIVNDVRGESVRIKFYNIKEIRIMEEDPS